LEEYSGGRGTLEL
ncbi:hypothetical protein MP638_005159, partial [Amoeboaphelidium occidentale]